MAPVSTTAAKSSSSKDEINNSSSSRRTTTSARPQEQALKCPRCDSQNTKFCYYNNYSLTQPRHFCKTCRRYWTKGGALRNVPIGGGCRKNKKCKPPSKLTVDAKDSNISSSSSDIGGLKFFHGLTPAMDFQLGGLNFSRLNTNNNSTSPSGPFNQFSSFGDISTTSAAISSSPCFNLDPLGSSLTGFNFPFSSVLKTAGEGSSGFNGDVSSSLALSIESLSSINQDLHWKLQQQRLAMLFGGENHKENSDVSYVVPLENNPIQKPQPILFHNLEATTPKTNACGFADNSGKGNGNLSTEWFFENSYAPPVNQTPTSSSGNGGNENVNSNWNNGMNQAWSNPSQYSAL